MNADRRVERIYIQNEYATVHMYDLIVVGSSFSGSMTAITAITASKSSKVLVIEKRKEPGTPHNSTGAVPIEYISKMNVMPSQDCIAGKTSGVEFIAPNGKNALIKKTEPDGMVTYPDRYAKWLSDKSHDLGCTVMTETLFKGLSVHKSANNGGVNKDDYVLTVSTNKGEFKAKYVVGADGAVSAVGQSIGLGERPAPEDLHLGIEYNVENKQIQDPEVFRLYLGHEVAPLGYAWSFPEGPDRLRVGLGIPESLGIRPLDLQRRFLNKYPEFKSKITKMSGGIIPTAPPLKTAVKGHVMLVGDAAHFCSPLHGGGIWFGMESGILAGTAVAQDQPELYDRLWKEQLGGVLSRHYKLKRIIYSMSDKNLDDMVSILRTYSDTKSKNYGFAHTIQKLMFSEPGFVLDMALKSLKYGLTVDVIKRVIVPDFRIA